MCDSHRHSTEHTTAVPVGSGVSVLVEDMTCGHCAGTIKSAIESSIPGAQVVADPQAKLVSVVGAGDLEQIKNVITLAGYTPAAAPAHS
jgi:copper chaperone